MIIIYLRAQNLRKILKEKLRKERIVKIKKYQANLKNLSKKASIVQATKIGKGLERTTQNNQNTTEKTATNGYKAKKSEFTR